jgi:hypothetical protein
MTVQAAQERSELERAPRLLRTCESVRQIGLRAQETEGHERLPCRLTAFEFSGATRPGCGEARVLDARRQSVGELTRVASPATKGQATRQCWSKCSERGHE